MVRTRPSRAETRQRVLDAAFACFSERGIAASSVDQVATTAGLTKGAVYSNFASKDELVLALMEEHAAQRIDASLEAVATGEGPLDLAAVGGALVREMHADAAWHRLLAEYFALAHHDPARQEALRRRRRQVRDSVTGTLEQLAAANGLTMPMPAAHLATVILALSNGLAVESEIDPGAVPDDLMGRVLLLIARAAGWPLD